MTEALAPSERHQYRHVDGRVVYEWDQTAEEVNVYIRAPQGVDAKQLVCDVGVAEVVLGIRGLPPYLKARAAAPPARARRVRELTATVRRAADAPLPH